MPLTSWCRPTKAGSYAASPGCRRFRSRGDTSATATPRTALRSNSRTVRMGCHPPAPYPLDLLNLVHLHDVGLQAADCGEDFLLLRGGHLEFRERLVQVLHRDVPVGLGNVQPGVGLLHAAAD